MARLNDPAAGAVGTLLAAGALARSGRRTGDLTDPHSLARAYASAATYASINARSPARPGLDAPCSIPTIPA